MTILLAAMGILLMAWVIFCAINGDSFDGLGYFLRNTDLP